MKTKLLLTILVISILTLSSTNIALAQTVAPGVSQGEIYEYNYTTSWSSTNPASETPDYAEELSRIQSFQFRITNIEGTTVNAEVTLRYRDGTNQTETGFVDVQSGSIHLSFGYLIIPGNLNVNDKIYPLGGEATINSTSTRTYSSGNRQTLAHTIEATYDSSYEKKELYIDGIKGIAVEYNFESRETVGSYTETFTETITNMNSDVWTIANPSSTAIPTNQPTSTQSSFPTSEGQTPVQLSSDMITIVVLGVVIIIVVVVALLLVKGRGRKKSRVDEEFAKYMKPKNS